MRGSVARAARGCRRRARGALQYSPTRPFGKLRDLGRGTPCKIFFPLLPALAILGTLSSDAFLRLMEKCVFFIPVFRSKGDASNINQPRTRLHGGCMATKVLVKECQYAEFKQSWQDEYLKWICAFANTEGGRIAASR